MTGLDPVALAARLDTTRRRWGRSLDDLAGVMSCRAWVSWSGGKDSTVALHMAHQVDPTVVAVHLASGLDYPETLAYLRDLARRWGVALLTVHAQPSGLDWMIRRGGWDHRAPVVDVGRSYHDVIMDGPARRAFALTRASLCVWGLRAQESYVRERLLTKGRGLSVRADGRRYYSPVWRWSATDIWAYLAHHQIPRNPVYDRLEELGVPPDAMRLTEMVCVPNLGKGGAMWLRRGWPDIWQRLVEQLPRLREWS